MSNYTSTVIQENQSEQFKPVFVIIDVTQVLIVIKLVEKNSFSAIVLNGIFTIGSFPRHQQKTGS
jgi:hypothetical protein